MGAFCIAKVGQKYGIQVSLLNIYTGITSLTQKMALCLSVLA